MNRLKAQNTKPRIMSDYYQKNLLQDIKQALEKNIDAFLNKVKVGKLFLIMLQCDKTQESQLNNIKGKCPFLVRRQ